MDSRILPTLRCPVCRAGLQALAVDVEEGGGRHLIRTGVLHCPAKHWYPIVNHVPLLLTFRTPLAERFGRDHADVLAQLPGHVLPDLAPMPGEASVQKTFTEEWGGLKDDARTFVYEDHELLALHRDVWLRFSHEEADAVDSVLDVGCGFGKEATILSRIFPNAEVFGVDLNLSLLEAGPSLAASNPRVHPVIASLFRLPFAAESFAHVHSQGVIHHTYSTHEAFKAIAAFARAGGSLFVWVYAKEDSHVVPGMRGVAVRTYWVVSHRLGRPVLSRLPGPLRNAAMFVLAGIASPLLRLRDRRGETWRFRNTLHGLRDAFTPRYAHQHGFNEVLMWFEDAGFDARMQSPARYRDLIGKRLVGVGVVGRRLRSGGAHP